MEPAAPSTAAEPSRRSTRENIAHLHLTAGHEPDVHLIDPLSGCRLHRMCVIKAADIASDENIRAIRVVVVTRNGARVSDLPEPLPRSSVLFVLGYPLSVHQISGEAVAVSLDRTLLPTTLIDDGPHVVPVTLDDLSRLLYGLVNQVLSTTIPAATAGTQTIARSILSLLASIYVEEITHGDLKVSHTPAEDLYRHAISVIRARSTEPDLSPAAIAEACAVTPRYLHMLFERRGETVSTRILTERLERSREDLSSPLFADKSISEIAAKWGFSTPSHFAQKFKSQYGMTPREWRTKALNPR